MCSGIKGEGRVEPQLQERRENRQKERERMTAKGKVVVGGFRNRLANSQLQWHKLPAKGHPYLGPAGEIVSNRSDIWLQRNMILQSRNSMVIGQNLSQGVEIRSGFFLDIVVVVVVVTVYLIICSILNYLRLWKIFFSKIQLSYSPVSFFNPGSSHLFNSIHPTRAKVVH